MNQKFENILKQVPLKWQDDTIKFVTGKEVSKEFLLELDSNQEFDNTIRAAFETYLSQPPIS